MMRQVDTVNNKVSFYKRLLYLQKKIKLKGKLFFSLKKELNSTRNGL